MPTILADGSSLSIPNVPYATLRSILFEKNFSGLPPGVTRQSGATVTWVEFAPPSTNDPNSPGQPGPTITINPNNVSQLFP